MKTKLFVVDFKMCLVRNVRLRPFGSCVQHALDQISKVDKKTTVLVRPCCDDIIPIIILIRLSTRSTNQLFGGSDSQSNWLIGRLVMFLFFGFIRKNVRNRRTKSRTSVKYGTPLIRSRPPSHTLSNRNEESSIPAVRSIHGKYKTNKLHADHCIHKGSRSAQQS